MKFRKKPVVIEASEWFVDGDHPRVVEYRAPDESRRCRHCGAVLHLHGWIETLEGGHIVCAGDWIIQGVQGECYPCKPDIFEQTYEPEEQNEDQD